MSHPSVGKYHRGRGRDNLRDDHNFRGEGEGGGQRVEGACGWMERKKEGEKEMGLRGQKHEREMYNYIHSTSYNPLIRRCPSRRSVGRARLGPAEHCVGGGGGARI